MQKRMVVMGTVSPLGFFMKGLFFVFFTLAVLSTGAFAQNDNWITVERIIIFETVENRETVSDASQLMLNMSGTVKEKSIGVSL